MYQCFCRRIDGTFPYNAYIYAYLYICICASVVEYTERFRERNGSVKCIPKVHLYISILIYMYLRFCRRIDGTVPYNAYQKSTFIYLYIYKCICVFVVEQTDPFRSRNLSVHGTVPSILRQNVHKLRFINTGLMRYVLNSNIQSFCQAQPSPISAKIQLGWAEISFISI